MSEREQFEQAFRKLHQNQTEKSLDILLEWHNHGTEEEPEWSYYSLAARDAFFWWQASREAIKAEQGDGGWIACADRMPNEGGRYWCYVEEQNSLGNSHYQSNCSWNGDEWGGEALSGRVTHWMPLPSPPAANHPIDTTPNQYDALGKGER